MHRGKHENAHASFGLLGSLRLNLPVGRQERDNVNGDERNGDYRPTPALHILVAQRNEHGATFQV